MRSTCLFAYVIYSTGSKAAPGWRISYHTHTHPRTFTHTGTHALTQALTHAHSARTHARALSLSLLVSLSLSLSLSLSFSPSLSHTQHANSARAIMRHWFQATSNLCRCGILHSDAFYRYRYRPFAHAQCMIPEMKCHAAHARMNLIKQLH